MPHLHLELPNGAAGDMLFAALIDCGADYNHIINILKKLDIADWDITLETTMRSGIASKNITITDKTIHTHIHTHETTHSHDQHTHNKDSHSDIHNHAHSHDHQHKHDSHAHSHDQHMINEHSHSEGHNHEHPHNHSHAHGERHLADMLKVLDNPALSPQVKKQAGKIFDIIATAEGAIHNRPKNKIHFHEISGIDTLIDVIGTALAIENLGISKITATSVATGSGTVKCAHGIMPVPAPATLKIVTENKIPIYSGSLKSELLTPTGAAILGYYVNEFSEFNGGEIISTGYGAGDKDFPETANTVRATLYNPSNSHNTKDNIIEITFTVDDATGEEIGALQEKLYKAGILESYSIPTIMKKNRPGFEIRTLIKQHNKEKIISIIFNSGLTIGMRIKKIDREILKRKTVEVIINKNVIPVKISFYQNKAVTIKAEADAVITLAEKTNKEFKELKQIAENKARKMIE